MVVRSDVFTGLPVGVVNGQSGPGWDPSPAREPVSETQRRSSEVRTSHAGAKSDDGGIRWGGWRHSLKCVTLHHLTDIRWGERVEV